MVVVAPLQKYSNRADESATATKRVRVRFLSAIEVQGGPYLKGYVKGTSLVFFNIPNLVNRPNKLLG